jgi:hypothetical protein
MGRELNVGQREEGKRREGRENEWNSIGWGGEWVAISIVVIGRIEYSGGWVIRVRTRSRNADSKSFY